LQGCRIYAVQYQNGYKASETAQFWAGLAHKTYGHHLNLRNFSNVFDFIMAIAYREQGVEQFEVSLLVPQYNRGSHDPESGSLFPFADRVFPFAGRVLPIAGRMLPIAGRVLLIAGRVFLLYGLSSQVLWMSGWSVRHWC